MRRIVLLLVMATVAGSIAYGAAASLDIGAANLGAGAAPVASCDADGIDVDYEFAVVTEATESTPAVIDYSTVAGLALSLVDEACDGQTLYYLISQTQTVEEGEALVPIASGSGELTVTGGNARVELGEPVSAADIDDLALTITG